MAKRNIKTLKEQVQLGDDIAVLLKKGCDIDNVKGTTIFTTYLEAEVGLSVTVTNGTYVVLVAQNEEIVFDMTYRAQRWAKVNIYRPRGGTWERVLKNRLTGQSDSNVLYRSSWFTD